MDEIVKTELRASRFDEKNFVGGTVEITTKHGNVYRVWLDYDGQPLIECATRSKKLGEWRPDYSHLYKTQNT